jgi:methylaspartate ammonia-lyase
MVGTQARLQIFKYSRLHTIIHSSNLHLAIESGLSQAILNLGPVARIVEARN